MSTSGPGIGFMVSFMLLGFMLTKMRRTAPAGGVPGGQVGGIPLDGNALVQEAMKYLGKPYFLGAGQNPSYPDPPYLDCGLMTKKALSAFGINVQRTVTEQVAAAPFKVDVRGRALSDIRALLRTGDLIGFDWTPGGRYSHTGIWTGDKVLHASSTAGEVILSPLSYFSANGFRSIYSFTRSA